MKRQKPQSTFMLCLRSDGSEDLEPRKVYQFLPNRAAAKEGYARIIDESGEDYLYPADYFVALRLPAGISRELTSNFSKSAGNGKTEYKHADNKAAAKAARRIIRVVSRFIKLP
jgi:hypothetical protein